MSRQARRVSNGLMALLTGGVMACAGGGSGPDSPAGPASPPRVVPVYPVVAIVFYDENGDGRMDPGETVRVPGVEVVVAGQSGRSERATGRTVVQGVPEGTNAVTVRSAPPYFVASPGTVMAVAPQPAGADILVPVTLPIGTNRVHSYMAFGDSITAGEGSRHVDGYKSILRESLRDLYGRGNVVDEAIAGTRSDAGAERIGTSLNRQRPAYTLIMYGTNDWNRFECKDSPPCFTVDSLRSMVGSAKATRSLPFVATIPPANPAVTNGADRNEWAVRMNEFIRTMARQEGAVLVDVYAAFTRAGNLSDLFTDHVHPNDRGYEIIAGEFFKAITQPAAPAGGVGFPSTEFPESGGPADWGMSRLDASDGRPRLGRLPRLPRT